MHFLYFIRPEHILMRNGVYIGTYPIKIAILGGIVGFTITVIAFRYVKTKLNKKSMFCELEIYFENKSIAYNSLNRYRKYVKRPYYKYASYSSGRKVY